jgi:PIN domain nuclease of toxin-antitoxin system
MRWILIYLDTHVVAWLYAGRTEVFGERARALINEREPAISPIVRLELQYLREIGRLTVAPQDIVDDLGARIGLVVCKKRFDDVVKRALENEWTRDPFDWIIVAQAALDDDVLITRDRAMWEHYSRAVW